MSDTFTCAQCRETFEKEWSEEEARAEQQENFPGLPDESMSVVCDDCYRELMGLPPATEVN